MNHRPDKPDNPDPADTPDEAVLTRALRASRTLEDAPEPLIQRAIGLWQPRPRPAPAPGVLRRLAAALSFDSAAPGAAGAVAAGLRSGGAHSRQLLYTADGRDVDLRVSAAAPGGPWQLQGQVLGPDEAGSAAVDCGGLHAETAWNELCEFHFDGLPAGPCTLTLRSADWELALPAITLGG